MHRIDAPGATIDNKFTEGNPSQGIPATQVSDDWLNDVQEEIANVIEAEGITLVKGTQNQLLAALNTLLGVGGTQYQQSILNNQAAPLDITGLVFDKTNYKAAQISFELYRQTDSENAQEIGHLFASHNSWTNQWRISLSSNLDDAGVEFTITAAGQVQYTSSNIAGANYQGKLRVANIIRFKQTL